ncbi:MAG: cation diffusion facilitator family transporter [Candidatus Polarisedimenticolaceae bacterium]|nr:cation diffusion facilitator family transporter [Candidatus Polarisedimenticolaceae bacterium]
MSNSNEKGDERYRVTRNVTIVGALVNTLLAFGKVIFGLLGQSSALLADGIHSFSDLLSDGLVLFAAYHANEAPDERHPYGHGRYETMGAMGLGTLLILVSLGIIWDAQERLFTPESLLQPDSFTLFVALVSILANEGLFQYTNLAAKKISSDLLRANAWHHRSDAISSVVVLVAIGGSLAGLPYLDAIAAIIVGLMVAKIGWDVIRAAMHELVDTSLDREQVEHIRQTIFAVGGVRDVHMLRTRRLGGSASADLHVQVEPWLSVSEGHMIADVVQRTLMSEISDLIDVTVHIDPENDEAGALCVGLPLRTEIEQLLDVQWRDQLSYQRRKRVLLHYLNGKIDVELILPLEGYQGLEWAEAQKTELQDHATALKSLGQIRLLFE